MVAEAPPVRPGPKEYWSKVLREYSGGPVAKFLQGGTMGPLRIIDPHLKPVGIPPPSNLREAKISPWWSAYKAAAKVEFDGHIKAKTWELVERSKVPKGKNILRGKWVFDDKRDESGRIIKFKARFVAMGFTQKYGVDYQETFAGVMVGKSFRIMLVILNEDPTHELEHWDAFTQATLEEDIYMFQPELFEDKPDKQVCKLRKSLYGLKQSAKNWGDLLRDMLKSSGFTPLFSDPCVHLSKVGEGWCVVSTHVDDIFILFNVSGKGLRDRLFKEVSSRVEVDNLGPVSWALKTNILRDRVNGVIKISQEGYINQLLQKYSISTTSQVPILPVNFSMDPNGTVGEVVDETLKKKYQGQIGSLWWLTGISRPDIYYAVHQCSKIQNKPNVVLENCLVKILEYLSYTKHIGVVYKRNPQAPLLSGYVDAAFASEDQTLSRTGYFYLFKGNLVSWNSENPTRIMTSSTEAECRGLVQISKENLWHRQFQEELKLYPLNGPTIVYEDNQSSITMSNDPGVPHKRSKHFGIEFGYFKQSVQLKEIQVEYISTEDQPADMLTKSLQAAKFEKFRDIVMGGEKLQHHFTE